MLPHSPPVRRPKCLVKQAASDDGRPADSDDYLSYDPINRSTQNACHAVPSCLRLYAIWNQIEAVVIEHTHSWRGLVLCGRAFRGGGEVC